MPRASKFAPNKRAVFVREMNGHNLGKVVLLKHRFDAMDRAEINTYIEFNNLLWRKGEKCLRTWIVESLGEPIVYMHNGDLTSYMTGPVPEYYLAPLDEFDEDESLWVHDAAPKLETVHG